MTAAYTVQPAASCFAVYGAGKPLRTPGKQPLELPGRALAEAVAAEWQAHGKFAAGKMPLTTLAQTAIDRIEGQRELIVESLLTYVDTDALAYRSGSSLTLQDRQKKDWDPVLAWLGEKLGVPWEVTSGVMPVDQSAELHHAVRAYINALDSMRLAAACMLAATCSSVALAIAVVERHLTAERSFFLSRLEEEAQAESWGRDAEADRRAAAMQEEIMAAGRFLDLLEQR